MIARLRRVAPRLYPAAQLILRGSAVGRVEPGISDVDVFVVYASGLGVREEQRAAEAVRGGIRRLNVPAPLVREVHGFARDELGALSRLGSVLYASAHLLGEPLAGSFPPEVPPPSARAFRTELLRNGLYFLERAFVQLALEAPSVGPRLAARSLSWVGEVCDALEGGEAVGPRELVLGHRRNDRTAAGWRELVLAARRFDALLGEAPLLGNLSPPLAVPREDLPVKRLLGPRPPALRAAALRATLSGPALFLGIDPTDRAAAETLATLAGRWRARPAVALRVMTVRQLERPALAKGAPWLGAFDAGSLHGPSIEARGSRAEIAFATAYNWLKELSRARGRAGAPGRAGVLRDAAASLLGGPGSRRPAASSDAQLREDARAMIPALVELAGRQERP